MTRSGVVTMDGATAPAAGSGDPSRTSTSTYIPQGTTKMVDALDNRAHSVVCTVRVRCMAFLYILHVGNAGAYAVHTRSHGAIDDTLCYALCCAGFRQGYQNQMERRFRWCR